MRPRGGYRQPRPAPRPLVALLCVEVGASVGAAPVRAGAEATSAATKVKLPRKPGCSFTWSKKSQRKRNVDRDRLPNIVDPDKRVP